jgi:hypothetical protein
VRRLLLLPNEPVAARYSDQPQALQLHLLLQQ